MKMGIYLRKSLWILVVFVFFLRCGSKAKDSDEQAQDPRVPIGWDARTDYSGSALTVTEK